jgi:D-beta-D-heptose 7-phosphate kinase/D-beta-D-heptose 1-phosphate adenosyltransferase
MIEDPHRIVRLIEGDWKNKHVLVVGDVMMDRYIWGDVERISPEAPVPVVRVAHRTEQPGGAANVAMNIAGLGARVTVAGFVGQDADHAALVQCLKNAGVQPNLTTVSSHPTTSKLRILGGQQQILRLDAERTAAYSAEAYAGLNNSLSSVFGNVDALVLSDYAKGVLSEEICRVAIRKARRRGIPVLVDPKHPNFKRYAGATTICPNLLELSAATGLSHKDVEPLLGAATAMLPHLMVDYLTVTLGNKGIAVLHPQGKRVFSAIARQVFDVSGAGDTVIATLTLGLASGLSIEDAVPLANIAAGIVVGKIGTVPITRNELLTNLTPHIELQAAEKLLSLEHLVTQVNAWRSKGQRVVFTNGGFDLLHVGHITLIETARLFGDRLIVAINSDDSVRGLKGPTRPIVREQDRGRVLAALAAVDAVVVFPEPTPMNLLETIRPDVIVKGGDYSEDTVVGAREVRSWGGVVKIVPIFEEFSTTDLITRAAAPVL